MKSAAQSAYEKVQAKLLRAPGMIEESERRLLFKAAFNCQELPIVEFGAFFGASTLALASGLSSRGTNAHQLTSIDAFEVEKNHGLHKHVIEFARRCKAEHLLCTTDGTKTNWINVTEATLGQEQKKVKLVKGIVDKNLDMSFLPEQIGVLHLDLPKDAETITPILQEAFPRVAKGGIIAFQDYAYQFSNELISFFELLEQRKLIKIINIAASSAFFEVCEHNISGQKLEEILQESLCTQYSLINNAISKYSKYPHGRSQELIALHAAAIRSLTTQEFQTSFQQQNNVANRIEIMTGINPKRAAFVLAELLTERMEKHR